MEIPRILTWWIVVAFILFGQSVCFVLTGKGRHLEARRYHHRNVCCSASKDDIGGGGGGGELMDAMRRMLEASWDAETMGDVPRDPSSAAEAAVLALQRAIRDSDDDDNAGAGAAYLIDLRFPPYDTSQGENTYDEVAAVEFCMELARRISVDNDKKSLILVKDEKTVQTVNRVLSARERSNSVLVDEDELDEDEEEDEENDDKGNDVDFYDDFADFGTIGSDGGSSFDDFADFGTIGTSIDSSSSSPVTEGSGVNDVDSFRQQLMSTWDESSSSKTLPEPTNAPKQKKKSKPKKAKRGPKEPIATTDSNLDSSVYRLASLFGSATIARGADMGGDVLQAVKENVQPSEDEQSLIVLSANQREDGMAIRTILQQTKKAALVDDIRRRVILVNCRLDPLPRELIGARTVYSILPLVAIQAASTTNPFQQQKQQQQQQKRQDPAATEKTIKVVVMRRYPRDWEVFVDDGSTGTFELASTAPVRPTETRGPPMQWVSNCIKKFLESRLG